MRILHVIHDFLPRHQAGSEIYAFELIQAQRALGLEAQVLCADYDPALTHGTFRRRLHEGVVVNELINNWMFSSFQETYRSAFLNRQIRRLLRSVMPDVLHIHNLLNLSFDIPAIARALRIPSLATLHDYTLVCPSGGQRVHQAESHICALIDSRRCSRCFAQHNFHGRLAFGQLQVGGSLRTRSVNRIASAVKRITPKVYGAFVRMIPPPAATGPHVSALEIEDRLAYVRRVFEAVDLFIAPSPNLANEYRRLGIPAGKLRVADYGFKVFTAPRTPPEGRLRIGFVGTLVWHKGAHVLLEAARALPPGRFEIRLFGDTSTFPDYVAAIREQARGLPVGFAGRFERDQVAAVYGGLDVLVVPSLWPENSPLVIHEAFMAGIPVVGSRQGGIQDLVTHGHNGLLYDAFSPASLAAALLSLLDDPQRLARMAAAVPEVKAIDRDAAECALIYQELQSRRPPASLPADGSTAASPPRTMTVLTP
jgi:glycosyltransferase involved in cell wall biosynthesis